MADSSRTTAEQGTALISVLLLTSLMLILGVLGTGTAQNEIRVARNELLAKKALYAAQAGLTHAFSLVKAEHSGSFDADLAGGGTGGALAGLGSLAALDGVDYLFHPFGDGANDGYFVRAEDNYDERAGPNNPTRDSDGKIEIISRGRAGGAERIVRARVERGSLFPQAVFSKLAVGIWNSVRTDSFDSRNGPYAPATVRSNGDVRSNESITLLSAGTVINGSAIAGTFLWVGYATVAGAKTQNASRASFPSIPPCGPPYYPNTAGITGVGAWSYSPQTGVLAVSQGGTVSLASGTYCFSQISLIEDSRLLVLGPVVVYLTAPSDMTGGRVVNTTGLASNFQVFSSYADVGVNGVAVSGGSSTYMAIYAPDTAVWLTGGTDFYGAVTGGSFQTVGSNSIHYDEALGSILGPTIQLTNWREVPNG
jgi:hypothetical protein